MSMRKAYALLVLGIGMAILPFLGFPYSWKDVLTAVAGILVIFVSFTLYKESKNREVKNEKNFDNFSENSGFTENKTDMAGEWGEGGGAAN